VEIFLCRSSLRGIQLPARQEEKKPEKSQKAATGRRHRRGQVQPRRPISGLAFNGQSSKECILAPYDTVELQAECVGNRAHSSNRPRRKSEVSIIKGGRKAIEPDFEAGIALADVDVDVGDCEGGTARGLRKIPRRPPSSMMAYIDWRWRQGRTAGRQGIFLENPPIFQRVIGISPSSPRRRRRRRRRRWAS